MTARVERPGPYARVWQSTLRFFNRDTWAAYGELAGREWWTPEAVRELQFTSLQEIVRFAWERNAFYRDLWRRHGVTPDDLTEPSHLARFPLVEKAQLREALASGAARSEGTGDDAHWLSSTGSTGEPFQFPLDLPSARLRRALTYRARRAAGQYDGDRSCKLWRTQANEPVRERFRKKLLRRTLELSFYDDADPAGSTLDDARLATMCERIRAFRPRVVEGYVSSLRLLAQHIIRNHENGVTPRAVVTGGEVLDEPTRQLLELAFRCTVFNRYGGTEAGLIAHECGFDPLHRLHVQSDAVFVEVVSGDEPVAPGERGELVVTSFHSRALPLVRYRLGDVGRLEAGGATCSCGRGFPFLAEIEGRVNDIFFLPGGRSLSSHVFHKVFRDARSIRAFQVIQLAEDSFECRVEPVRGYVDEREWGALRARVASYLSGTTITWRVVPRLEPGPGGKFRQCVRQWEPPNRASSTPPRGEHRESA